MWLYALVEGGVTVVRRKNERESGVTLAETSQVFNRVFFGAKHVQDAATHDFESDLRFRVTTLRVE